MKQFVTKAINKAMYIAPFALAGSALAEGETSGSALSLTGVEAAADEIGTAISGLLTGKILDNVKIVAFAALGIWAFMLVLRWIRRAGR